MSALWFSSSKFLIFCSNSCLRACSFSCNTSSIIWSRFNFLLGILDCLFARIVIATCSRALLYIGVGSCQFAIPSFDPTRRYSGLSQLLFIIFASLCSFLLLPSFAQISNSVSPNPSHARHSYLYWNCLNTSAEV